METSSEDVFNAVQEEFSALRAGRGETISGRELDFLRHYARKRTDLRSSESELTIYQRAWKVHYEIFDQFIEKLYGVDLKARIDDAEDKNEVWQTIQRIAQRQMVAKSVFKDRGPLISFLSIMLGLTVGWLLAELPGALLSAFILWILSIIICAIVRDSLFAWSVIEGCTRRLGRRLGSKTIQNSEQRISSSIVFLKENQDKDFYAKILDELRKIMDVLFNSHLRHFSTENEYRSNEHKITNGYKSQEKEERRLAAEMVLKLVNEADKTFLVPLMEINKKLGDLLYDFYLLLSHFPDSERKRRLWEWYLLSKALFLKRIGYTNYLFSSWDWDRLIAQELISHNGEEDFALPARVAKEMARISAFARSVQEDDDVICGQRAKLSEELFGHS
ncbi:MAG TPA: hypothetical protein VLL97_08430 [Acidobacteriota bacterium]|nr:hypothetical protein [Acidobacteriota bacterium]